MIRNAPKRRIGLLGWIVIAIGLAVVFARPPAPDPAAEASRQADIDRAAADRAAHAAMLANLAITSSSWTKAGFDNIAIATFTIRNGNAVAVRDVTVTCSFYAPSGTQVSTGTETIYRTFPAHAKLTARNVDLGFINTQAATGRCSIADAKF